MEIKREVKFEITLCEVEANLLQSALSWMRDEGELDPDLFPFLEGLRELTK